VGLLRGKQAQKNKNIVVISKSYKEMVKHTHIYWQGKEAIKTSKERASNNSISVQKVKQSRKLMKDGIF